MVLDGLRTALLPGAHACIGRAFGGALIAA